jgi:hypothetical protein
MRPVLTTNKNQKVWTPLACARGHGHRYPAPGATGVVRWLTWSDGGGGGGAR